MENDIFSKAIEIRTVEEKLLELFSKGRLSGTVHTSIGQEFSALAFCYNKLINGDKVFSNHRCHGHFMALTNNVKGFLFEMMGKADGVCGGIGSSQHLFSSNFMSNGTQGNLAPVAAGCALSFKLNKQSNIALLFIGDGTLGEGVIYETMNIASLFDLPLLIVCENNKYAQSTPIQKNLAGSIQNRAQSFNLKYYYESTQNHEDLLLLADESINYVRNNSKPAFFEVDTYRLAPHSKGDDDRDIKEINLFKSKDPIVRYMKDKEKDYIIIKNKVEKKIEKIIKEADDLDETKFDNYHILKSTSNNSIKLSEIRSIKKFQGRLLNEYFIDKMENNHKMIFIGEDVHSPYGGAFKVAKNLSILYPDRVFTTPISESAIAGLGNGLALSGFKPYVEIMFGDFMPLVLEQIINGASKFKHMYNHNINCPVVFRTPMGGKRGYGPTHSQSLERLLIGIDNVKVFSLNVLVDPKIIYDKVYLEDDPSIVVENKLDYGKFILNDIPKGYCAYLTNEPDATCIIKKENIKKPDITVFTYGGSITDVILALDEFTDDTNFEIIVPTVIHPLNIDCVIASLQQSKRLIAIEEGSLFGGVTSELVANINEQVPDLYFRLKRIGAIPISIPSVRSLENKVLPSKDRIIYEIKEFISGCN